MAEFKDHFSSVAANYAEARPHYPKELFAFLSETVSGHECVWDCATGNGQAAVDLAEYFDRVEATDASAEQIKNVAVHPKVKYSVATAEKSGLDAQSVDLVTVAQALHWFDIGKFYAEVKRVLKPDGWIAVWTYDLFSFSEKLDEMVQDKLFNPTDHFWPPERKLVRQKYATIPFPFDEIQVPDFTMHNKWSEEQLLRYVRTWSATRNWQKTDGGEGYAQFERELMAAWPGGELKTVTMPVYMRMGKMC